MMIAVLVGSFVITACIEEPPPRSFTEFMDDRIAREGVLVRCNADRTATADDPECINARRAAAAIAAQGEAEKREQLEAQSEARLVAARQRYDAQQAAARDAEIAAASEEEREYESQWQEPGSDTSDATAAAMPPAESPPIATGSASVDDPAANLEPITLPRSVLPPLTTIGLPHSAKPLEYRPPEPELEEIVVPHRVKQPE